MEKTILTADVIARVSYLSKWVTVAQRPSSTFWVTLLEFRFRVHEYLEGPGPSVIGGVVYLEFETEAQALATVAKIGDAHDSRWDSRQAIVFLRSDDWWMEDYPLGTGQHWFGHMISVAVEIGLSDGYTVASRFSKLWLPEAIRLSGDAASSADEKLFLLDAPATTTAAVSFTMAPTISLGALRNKIAILEAEANAGGTPEYRECVETSYGYESNLRNRVAREGPMPHTRHTNTIRSGLPADTFIRDYHTGSGPSRDEIGIGWFEGPDKDVVKFVNIDFSPYSPDEIRFTRRVVTTRPLPAGGYVVYPNETWHGGMVCARYPESSRRYKVLYLTTRGPEHVLHEAFFDPVEVGNAVRADGTNGVLSPADFSLYDTTMTIQSLKWEDGVVTMELSPDWPLRGYVLNFIDLTGTTTLSLAPASIGPTGLTWAVPDQPWSDGDLLMLRLREPLARP